MAKKSFKERFHQAVLQAESSDSLYKAFVGLSMENLPRDTSELYSRLKNRGYIAETELDMDVYVKHVASKHAGKFSMLYKKLFEKFGGTFSDCVDIVVWGSGCGLDLLALYDQAMRQKNPNFWMVVKSITLIDISLVALQRAAEMAEVLFPSAIGRIKTMAVDFKCEDSLRGIELMKSLSVVPRIHLLSNVFDLFEGDDFKRFTNKIKLASMRKGGRWNDVYVAFSPSYPNVHEKMKAFRSEFVGLEDAPVCDFIFDKDAPSRSYCSAFWVQTLGKTYFEWLQKPGDNSYKQLRRIALGDDKWFKMGKWDELFDFFSCKQEREQFLLNTTLICEDCPSDNDKKTRCIVLIPEKATREKLLIVKIGAFEHNDKWKIAKYFFGKAVAGSEDKQLVVHAERIKSDIRQERDIFRYVRVMAWNCEAIDSPPKMELDEWDNNHKELWKRPLDREIDFSGMYLIRTDAVKPLPSLSGKQKDIALRRRQYLRVRGGPGTGKTVTMLWRGVCSLMRTHMPVLLLCKTNTLVTHHERLLAATFLSVHREVDRVTRKMIQFDTIDHYLCGQNKIREGCRLVGHRRSAEEMDRICDECRMRAGQSILAPNSTLKSSEQYGAVLIDEAQIIDPDYIKQVYRLTGASNPYREFYLFCDEEQSIRGGNNVLVADDDTNKMVVKAPATGFGKFVTIKENFRVANQDLMRIYKFVQDKMSDRYDTQELGMVGGDYVEQGLLGIQAAFAISKADSVTFGDLESWILPDINMSLASGDILILSDDEGLVREFSGVIESRNLGEKWMSTHMRERSFSKEQLLRRDFYGHREKIHVTTIDCAQGQTFDRVVLILRRLTFEKPAAMEELFTGMTRARSVLRVIDATPRHEIYDLLKQYNSYEVPTRHGGGVGVSYEPEEIPF